MSEKKNPSQQAREAEQGKGPAKRPYKRPEVETRPLFERMALTCDIFADPPTPS